MKLQLPNYNLDSLLDSLFSGHANCYELAPFKCLVTFRRSDLVLVKLAA